MELKKKGIVFKVAYGWIDENKYPQRTTLCRLFWRFLFWLFIAWPIVWTVVAIVATIMYVVGFFFAARPTFFKDDRNTCQPMCYYHKWPKIKERRIYPIWPVLAIILGSFFFLNAAELRKDLSGLGHGLVKFTILSPVFWKVALAFAVLVAAVWAWSAAAKSEPYMMFKAYLRAKKEKVCPIIKIVD